ncbi:hypothetical protein AB0E06_00445 [Streptomyces sp. NPDC048109]
MSEITNLVEVIFVAIGTLTSVFMAIRSIRSHRDDPSEDPPV